jgi:hypothetical protein
LFGCYTISIAEGRFEQPIWGHEPHVFPLHYSAGGVKLVCRYLQQLSRVLLSNSTDGAVLQRDELTPSSKPMFLNMFTNYTTLRLEGCSCYLLRCSHEYSGKAVVKKQFYFIPNPNTSYTFPYSYLVTTSFQLRTYRRRFTSLGHDCLRVSRTT